MVSVLLYAHVERVSVSRMRDFVKQIGLASRWRSVINEAYPVYLVNTQSYFGQKVLYFGQI